MNLLFLISFSKDTTSLMVVKAAPIESEVIEHFVDSRQAAVIRRRRKTPTELAAATGMRTNISTMLETQIGGEQRREKEEMGLVEARDLSMEKRELEMVK